MRQQLAWEMTLDPDQYTAIFPLFMVVEPQEPCTQSRCRLNRLPLGCSRVVVDEGSSCTFLFFTNGAILGVQLSFSFVVKAYFMKGY